jgi:ElaB/YqjD/DUF883 family membrane-anchored ribosome-binding protein
MVVCLGWLQDQLVRSQGLGKLNPWVWLRNITEGRNEMDTFNEQSGQSSYGESTGSSASGVATRMKEDIADKAADVKDKITDLGRKAADKIDGSRESAAGALDQTASSLHSGSDKLVDVAHSTADKIQITADYLRNTDLKGMANDVQDIVKRYPGQSLAVAAALGFLVARGLRRSG